MRRFILTCVLAVLATCGRAADTVMYYGPAGEVLTSGKYIRVTISWVNGQAVMTQQVVLDIGGGPVPPPPPPPVTGIEAKVSALILAVTDADKATTAGKIGEAYTLAATLGELDPNRDAGKIRESAEAIIGYYLKAKDKAAAWKSFTDGMVALTSPMNALEVIATYKVTAGLLGGGPVPPPNPPTPPGPVTAAVKAVILIESGDQTAAQSTLLNQMRNEKPWSKLVTVLDPDQQTEANQPDPQTVAIKAAIGSRPLPRLVYLDSVSSFVGDEDLPAKWDECKAAMTAKGVKP